MSDLILHRGASLVQSNDVYEVATPEPSGSHYPIAHGELLDAVKEEMTAGGLVIAKEQHSLTREGNRYFGILTLSDGDDYAMVVGVRNSHDRSFSASLCLGSSVFVCDNLSFCSEIVLARKHTRFISRDLQRLTNTAVSRLCDRRVEQDQRIESYKNTDLNDRDAHDLIIRGVVAKALLPTKLPDVVRQWHEPRHDDFQVRNAWSLFNAFTEVMKGTEPNRVLRRTRALHGLFDTHCGLLSA